MFHIGDRVRLSAEGLRCWRLDSLMGRGSPFPKKETTRDRDYLASVQGTVVGEEHEPAYALGPRVDVHWDMYGADNRNAYEMPVKDIAHARRNPKADDPAYYSIEGDYDDPDMVTDLQCGACGGQLSVLGKLGKKPYYRCRACGLDWSPRHADSAPPTPPQQRKAERDSTGMLTKAYAAALASGDQAQATMLKGLLDTILQAPKKNPSRNARRRNPAPGDYVQLTARALGQWGKGLVGDTLRRKWGGRLVCMGPYPYGPWQPSFVVSRAQSLEQALDWDNDPAHMTDSMSVRDHDIEPYRGGRPNPRRNLRRRNPKKVHWSPKPGASFSQVLASAPTRTLYKAYNRLRRTQAGRVLGFGVSPEEKALVLIDMAKELAKRGYQDPQDLWAAGTHRPRRHTVSRRRRNPHLTTRALIERHPAFAPYRQAFLDALASSGQYADCIKDKAPKRGTQAFAAWQAMVGTLAPARLDVASLMGGGGDLWIAMDTIVSQPFITSALNATEPAFRWNVNALNYDLKKMNEDAEKALTKAGY